MGPWLRLVPLLALWAIPVVAVAVAVPNALVREEASVEPPLPKVVTVGSQSTDYRTSVAVSVGVERAGVVRSPVAGLLTSVAEAGSRVHPGVELFAVDGAPVLAQPGAVPLHRELRWGDRGDDVDVLGQFLVALDLLDADRADDRFGPAVRAAVVQFQEDIGVRADGVFRPSYVAFVPESVTTVGDPQQAVGTLIAAGAEIFDAAPVPTRIGFTPTSTNASLIDLADAELTLAFGDLELPVSSLDPTPEELPSIHAALRGAVGDGIAQLMTSDGAGGVEQYGGGLLRLAEPRVHGVVPGTAVYVTATGAQCLFQDQGSGDWEVVRLPSLEPAVGALGAVYVDAELIDTRIARDPLVLDGDLLDECR